MFVYHLEDHHFQSNGLIKFYFFISKIHDDTECGKKSLELAKKASQNAYYRDGTASPSRLA